MTTTTTINDKIAIIILVDSIFTVFKLIQTPKVKIQSIYLFLIPKYKHNKNKYDKGK